MNKRRRELKRRKHREKLKKRRKVISAQEKRGLKKDHELQKKLGPIDPPEVLEPIELQVVTEDKPAVFNKSAWSIPNGKEESEE